MAAPELRLSVFAKDRTALLRNGLVPEVGVDIDL